MDPYLSSCLLLMAIMSTLVSYIYGSSVGIQVRKTKIWPSLALEVTLGKFSFSQVKKHISAHNFCNGQKFQCSISGPKYQCAVIWCRVRTSGDRMQMVNRKVEEMVILMLPCANHAATKSAFKLSPNAQFLIFFIEPHVFKNSSV